MNPWPACLTKKRHYTAQLIREATAGRTLLIVEHDMDVGVLR